MPKLGGRVQRRFFVPILKNRNEIQSADMIGPYSDPLVSCTFTKVQISSFDSMDISFTLFWDVMHPSPYGKG